jgi:hypothetical protein
MLRPEGQKPDHEDRSRGRGAEAAPASEHDGDHPSAPTAPVRLADPATGDRATPAGKRDTGATISIFGATWELRFGPGNCFRVFCEVDHAERMVWNLAIAVKKRDRLMIGGQEFEP